MAYCPFCMNEIDGSEEKCPSCGKALKDYQQAPHTLARGVMLNNRYLVGGVIGEGGFGITYIGLDTLLQVRVAIKEFFPNGMVNRNNTVSNEVLSVSTESARELFSKSRENFLREARTLAKFTNEPGIVSVRDFFEENKTVYIVMEYLEGITLKSYLSQVGTMSPNNTVCLLMPVFNSLGRIHEKKLIHRDISPDNIMLCGESIKLLDFGAAREFADERSLSVMLKHGYAPMEQYRRHGTQGAWTDVYAICATMYKCVTGQIPPDAPDRVFEDTLKTPTELGADSIPEFDKVLMHGLAIKPEDRIQSIGELIAELDSVPGIDIGAPSPAEEAPAPAAPPSQPNADNDVRLSEYVSHSVSDADKNLVKNVTAPPPTPEPPKKKKNSKTPLIIAAAAAAVLVIGGGITAAVLLSGNNNSETVSSTAAEISRSESAEEFSKTESSKEESSKPESSKEESSKPESSKEESSKPESSKEESSKPESSKEESSKPESSKEESSKPESSQQESTGYSAEDIVFPALGDNFGFQSGLMLVNQDLFGKSESYIKALFGSSGTLFSTQNHPIYGNKYKIILVPVDSPLNTETEITTIDLYFSSDKLVMIRYEVDNETHKTVLVDTAKTKFGKPVSETADSVKWQISGTDITFEMGDLVYPDTKNYAQSYMTSGFSG